MSSNALLWPSQGTIPERMLDKYKWLKLPSQGFGGVAPEVEFEMAYEPENWLDANFLQRIPLTINGGQVPSTQNDFPLLIDDTYTELIGMTISQLRFAGIDNIQLEYEIELFDSITGELVAWVKKPTVSDGDIVYVYFDNVTAVDEQNSAAVWTENFNAVYHSNQTTFGASSTLDSTSNGLDGTPQNMDIGNQVAGQIDGSLDYDGGNERIIIPDNSLLDPGFGPFTVTCWIQTDTPTAREDILGKIMIVSPFFPGWNIRQSDAGADGKILISLGALEGPRISVLGSTVLDTSNHLIGFTYDGSGDALGVKLYVDGNPETNNIVADNVVLPISANTEFNIANTGNLTLGLPFDGNVDEVNLAAIERTANWMKTVHNNQVDTSTFYSTGTVEAVPPFVTMAYEDLDTMEYEPANWADASYLQRFPLTINANQVPSTQNDFPLLINDTFPELIGESVGSIRIGTNDITLNYEIQEFDTITGELIAWVLKPTVSDGDVIFVYFDNTTAPDNQNPFAVWSDYQSRYSLSQVPAGDDSILDSTRQQNNGTPNGTTSVPGKIGQALDFDGVDDKVNISNTTLNFDYTISLWVETTQDIPIGDFFSISTGNQFGVLLEKLTDGRMRFFMESPPGGSSVNLISVQPVNDGVFHLLHLTFDSVSDLQKIFLDGVEDSSTANTLPILTGLLDCVFGQLLPGGSSRSYDGILDEFRTFRGVYDEDRSETEFNNQNAPATFYTKGAVEDVPT